MASNQKPAVMWGANKIVPFSRALPFKRLRTPLVDTQGREVPLPIRKPYVSEKGEV